MVMINWKQDFLSSNSVGNYTRDKQIGSYDYRPNWTQLGSFTIIYGKGGVGNQVNFNVTLPESPDLAPPLTFPPSTRSKKNLRSPKQNSHIKLTHGRSAF